MARVLSVNVWVDGVYCPAGSTPRPELAAQIGDHAWTATDDAPVGTVTVEVPVQVEVPVVVTVTDDGDAVVTPDLDGTLIGGVVTDDNDAEPPSSSEDVPPVAPSEELALDVDPSSLVEPPRAGRGASSAAWAEYATALGIELSGDMGRDDIIAAVDARTALA